MFSKSSIITLLIFLALGLFVAVKLLPNSKKTEEPFHYNIGIVKMIDHPALDRTEAGIKDYLTNNYDRIKIFSESAQADLAIANQIIQKFIQAKVDVIITIGTTVSQVAMKKTQNIPIVFASVTDPVASGLVEDLNRPGNNVTGVSNFCPEIIAKELKLFKELLPNLKTLGMLYNPGESNSLFLIQKTEDEAKKLGIEIKTLTAQNTHEAVFAAQTIANSVDALFINNDNTALAAISGIVTAANKIPVFSSDIDSFDQGILAALGPNQYKIGEEAGRLALAIAKVEIFPQTTPVIIPKDDEIVISQEKVEQFNVKLPMELMDQSK